MRHIVRAGVIALAITLSGCAGSLQKIENAIGIVTGDIVTPQAVYVAINAFDAVEASATNYLRLPRCSGVGNLCRTPSTSAAVITWIRAGRADRKQLLAALKANPAASQSLVSVYNDLTNTTSQLGALVGH